MRIFDGSNGPDREIVLANAAAALLVAGRVETLGDGVRVAARAIDEGVAASLLDRWGPMSRGL